MGERGWWRARVTEKGRFDNRDPHIPPLSISICQEPEREQRMKGGGLSPVFTNRVRMSGNARDHHSLHPDQDSHNGTRPELQQPSSLLAGDEKG